MKNKTSKNIIGLFIVAILGATVLTSSIVFAENARQTVRKMVAISVANRMEIKDTLKNYFNPVSSGNGIGTSGDSYITAKWYVASVRTLNLTEIKQTVSDSNATTWAQLRRDLQDSINSRGVVSQKGRISIGNTTYLLTSLHITNTTVSADINALPNYVSCSQQNITSEACEGNATKAGDMSLSLKMPAPAQGNFGQKVWGGTLDLNSVAYSFVAFVAK
jgi:hypothetical protein